MKVVKKEKKIKRKKTLRGNEIVKQRDNKEKTKTKLDKDGNIIWSKTKKKGKLRYKKDKLKNERPPNPMPPIQGKTDPGKTYQA